MPFPLFQFITPLEAKPDPNGAVQNAMSGMQSLIDIKKDKQHQAQQSSQFQQEQGLRVNDQLMRGQSMAHGEDKDVAGMLAQYNKFLADGDDASAAGMAPAMKAMGLDLVKRPDGDAQQPAPPTQPDAAPAMPALGGAKDAHLDPNIAPKVTAGAARPFAPGEYVTNPDKSWSSERTMTVTNPALNNGAATNIPSIWIKDGKPYQAKSEDEAVQLALQSGLPWKSYGDLGEADKASVDRENQWTTPKGARKADPLYGTQQKGKPVPPLLTKFMAAQPKAEEPPPDQLGPVDVEGHDESSVPQAGPSEAPRPAGRLPTYEAFHRGKSLGVIDPNTFHTQNKEAAGRVGGAFLGSLPDDISEQFRPGLDEPATGEEAKDAVHNDLLLTLQGMRSANKGKGKGGGGTGIGGILDDPKEAARLDGEIRQWTQAAAQDNAVKSLAQTATELEGAEAQLRSGLAADQRVGIGNVIKSLSGKMASDKEGERILGAAGGLAQWETMVRRWVDSGQVAPALTQGLARMAASAHRRASERARLLANNAATAILGNPLVGGRIPPAAQEAVRKHIVTTMTAESGGDSEPGEAIATKPEFLK